MNSKSWRKKFIGRDGTSSGASSRGESTTRTPLQEDDSDYEEDAEVDYNRIEDYLTSKLAALDQGVLDDQDRPDRAQAADKKQVNATLLNKQRIQSESTTFNEILFSLTRPRTEVSTPSRELLLAQLYKIIVGKPLVVYNEENAGTQNYVDEVKVQQLVGFFNNAEYRTDSEFLYLFRSMVATIVSDIDENSQFVTPDFLTYIQKLIDEPASNTVTNKNKSNLIVGYTSLVLALQHGSSSFGIDTKIQWLMERAESLAYGAIESRKSVEAGDREYSTLFDKNEDKRLVLEAWLKVDGEVAVAMSAFHGIAVLLTLLDSGEYLNEIIEDLMIRIVPLVDNEEIRDISKAAGRVVAIMYELYDYTINPNDEEEDDQDFNSNAPYYEQEALFSIFERLTNLSSKKVAKKEKKEFHSVFRNILLTLRAYLNPTKRIEIYKKSPTGRELLDEIMDSTYVKLSKYKSLSINSWFLYMRLRNLKWCFSFGLHNQLIANEDIRDILKEKESEFQFTSTDVVEEILADSTSDADFALKMEKQHIIDDKTRTNKIKKQRAQKIGELENLQLEDEESI